MPARIARPHRAGRLQSDVHHARGHRHISGAPRLEEIGRAPERDGAERENGNFQAEAPRRR